MPLLLHTFCDYLTSYGVPLFSPFTFREYSADVVPAVTVIPMLFMAWGLHRIHQARRHGWSATKPLWMAWAAYLLVSFGGQAYAGHLMQPYRTPEDRVTIVSGLFNPFGWTAVEQRSQCCRYQASRINVITRSVRPNMTLEAGTDELTILGSLASDEVQRFIGLNRWPVARAIPTESGWNVEWGKVIFSSRGVVKGQLRVYMGLDGKIKKEEHIFDFWDPVENSAPVGPVEVTS
jgi:hypothetical protein